MDLKQRFSLEIQLNSFVDKNSKKKLFKAEKFSAAIRKPLGEVVSQQLISHSAADQAVKRRRNKSSASEVVKYGDYFKSFTQ
jgi:hypothetical protein